MITRLSLIVILMLAIQWTALAQPANNNFASATDISLLIDGCSPNAAYTTVAATADQSAGTCWSNGPNYNVWFKFTATATQYMKVQVKVGGAFGTMQYPMVALWDASLTQLNCQNQQGAATSIETDYYGLTNGQVYYISVDNFVGAGYRGTFSLCLSSTPDYNFFEGAADVTTLINGCSPNAAYTTLNATADRSAGTCWSNGPNYNRWFKFTASGTHYIKAQVKVGGAFGTMQYPMVALWDASLTQLNCQNQQGASTSIETDYYGLTTGQTYYISVDNFVGTGYRGTFSLCLSDVVDYNFFEGAADVTTLINGCSPNAAYTTLNATADRSAGTCWSNGPNYNRWFKFTASGTHYIKAQVKVGGAFGTMQYPMVALWDASLTQLNCQNQQGASTSIETDYYGLTTGQTYYISVDNFVGTGYRGTFSLCLSDVVDYNFFEGAADVTTLINGCSPNAAYTTLNATADRSAGTCWSNGPNYNRWFKFTASGTHYIKAQVKVGGAFGTMQYPMVALWDASLTQLNCQNQQGASTSIETDYYGLTTGQTYYISVDNFVGTGYRGTFSLCLSDVVDYNYYEGATDVTGYINKCSPNAAYTTLNATADRAAGTCWSNGPNYNRWFKFTASATQYIKISVNVGGTSGTMQYPMVALWTSALAQLNCQNQQGASTSIETDYYGLTTGQTYYISVDNFVGTGYRGTFTLCLSDVPDYNYYEGATDVTGLINGCSSNAAYTTLNATADRSPGSCWSNGPNYNRWFKFTATATQYIKVSVNVGGASGMMQYPMVALWTSALAQLNCQNQQGASTSIETDYYGLTAGQTYYISVDNFVGTGYRGTFTLCLSDVMDYNYYEGAVVLTDLNNWCSANAQYTTLNATADKNKGTCWSNGPNYNRWFKFTAGYTSATIQVKVGGVEGTMQYPMVALWASNGTTQLACTNQAGATTDISMSYASLTVGNTYYISVDNFVGTGYRGTFTLCITNVNPTQYYSRADGDWSNTNTWSTIGFGGAAAGTLPGAGNIVNIQDNSVTVTSAQQCAEIVLTNSAAATALTIDNATLTVNGKVTQTNSGNNTSTLTLQNNGSMSILNNYNLNRNGGTGGIQVVLTAGSLSVGQDMNWNETAGTVALNTMTASNSSSVSVTRDLYLNWTGGMKQQLTFNNNATLDIGRDFALSQIAAGISEAIFNNSAQLRLKRNVLRGGTPYGNIVFNGSSTFVFNGTANQQVIPASAGAGGDAITYNNVTFNNTSGFLFDYTMGGIANIPGTLTLTNGVAQTTSSNYIQMLSGSTNGLGSPSSYVSGPFYVNLASSLPTTLNLPIGKSSDYRPVILNVTHSDATSVTYNGELFNASAAALLYTIPGTIERVSGAHYWIVNRSAVANLTTATATLYYGSNDGVSDPPNLRFVKTNGAGTVWFDLGGTGSAAPSGFITSNAFTTFSTMTIANATGGSNSLPIQLIDFKGTASGDKVELSWTTATEVNNDYFGIERSEDGLLFTEIARVPGKGTSFVTNRYTYTDESPIMGRSYYRLSQTDFNKKSALSKVIYVDVNKINPSVLVYPNPSSGESFSIGIKGLNSSEEVQVIIYDLTGKQVLSFPLTAQSNGSARVDVSKTLSSGFYIVTVEALSGRLQTKFVVR